MAEAWTFALKKKQGYIMVPLKLFSFPKKPPALLKQMAEALLQSTSKNKVIQQGYIMAKKGLDPAVIYISKINLIEFD